MNKKMRKIDSKKYKIRNGFTLLEALVAISILMVAVVAPITIAQKGLSSAVYTKNQMIASYLAQDAIEYIKNKRDEDALNRVAGDTIWNLNSLFSDCMNPNYCSIDTNFDTGEGKVINNTDNALKITNGFYGYPATGGKETNFTRKIQITETIPDQEASIQVIVGWGDSAGDVDVKAWIYNY